MHFQHLLVYLILFQFLQHNLRNQFPQLQIYFELRCDFHDDVCVYVHGTHIHPHRGGGDYGIHILHHRGDYHTLNVHLHHF